MWIGLDVGTTAVKAAAYSSDGAILAMADAASPARRVENGGVEQDMAIVWETSAAVLRELTGQIDVAEVNSIGVAAQGDGFWAIDSSGTPAGPAMLWNDTRSSQDLLRLQEKGNLIPVAHACRTSLWPGTSGALWRWVADNRPELGDNIATVFTCANWIGLRLTGLAATDYSNASIPFLDFDTRDYSQPALKSLDCEKLAAKLAPPRPATDKLGALTADAAAQTGLPAGLPVAVGTLDLASMIVGMGLDKPGQAMMIIGTTAVVNILVDKVEPTDVPVGASVLHPTSNTTIRVLAPTTGAAAFDWFASLHPASLSGESAGEIADKINALASDVPPGSNGVTFLPYLNGERAPFVEPDIQASFNGMTANTTRADLSRSVMEGTGFSLAHCIEAEGGLPDGPVLLTGGGSKNPVWCQIIADIVGNTVRTSSASDQGLWGAACIGATAAGFGEAIDLSRRDEELRTFTPDHDNHQIYRKLFERYKVLSEASRKSCAALRSLESKHE